MNGFFTPPSNPITVSIGIFVTVVVFLKNPSAVISGFPPIKSNGRIYIFHQFSSPLGPIPQHFLKTYPIP